MNKIIALIFGLLAALAFPLAASAATVEQYKVRKVYAFSTAAFAPAGSATDICTIYGSASATCHITYIAIAGTQTTASQVNLFLIKRSAVDTTGTPVAATGVPLDALSPAVTATVNAYTANPGALGTAVGTIGASTVFIPAPATATASFSPTVLFDEKVYGKPITLNSATEGLAINANAVTITGGSLLVTIYETEER